LQHRRRNTNNQSPDAVTENALAIGFFST
jgi:hypothetical protein